jgi:hypothetical protein
MKMTKYVNIFLVAGLVLLNLFVAKGGNPDRAGQAGAPELLVNPWARCSGWAGANSGSVRGIEAGYLNIAGTAFTKKTELVFARTNLLSGSGLASNTFGLSQRVGTSSVISFGVNSISAGEIQVTTVDLPEGDGSKISPQFITINFSYAKEFSHSIYGGLNVKVLSEGIPNASAQGVAFDAGIQYVTGKNDQIKFGISMKNVGPPMKYTGDGLSFRFTNTIVNSSVPYETTAEQRSENFEMPSLVNIGGTYDFKLTTDHRLTAAATFTSNSFTKDQYALGMEYGFKTYFMIRGGYQYEEGISDFNTRTTAYTGPCGGVTLEVPLGKNGITFGVDYSFRATTLFNNTHSFGARISL